jgi:hypothetical protein
LRKFEYLYSRVWFDTLSNLRFELAPRRLIEGVVRQLGELRAGKRYLFRLDSGNDAWDTLKTIRDGGQGNYFIIKRNKRKESDEMWRKRAKRLGKRAAARRGKKVRAGPVKIHPRKGEERLNEVYCVFEVTERKTDREGNRFLIPETEVNSWWTNPDCGAEKVIERYHGHGQANSTTVN